MTGVSQTSSLAECLTCDRLQDPVTGINSAGNSRQIQRLLKPKGAPLSTLEQFKLMRFAAEQTKYAQTCSYHSLPGEL